MRIQWSMTQILSGCGRPIMSLPTKFKLNSMSGLSTNACNAHQIRGQEREGEFSGAWPTVNQARRGPLWVCPPNLSKIQLNQSEAWKQWKFHGVCPKVNLEQASGVSVNGQKLLDQSEARKRWKFSGAWPKINHAERVPQWVYSPKLSTIWSAVCLEKRRNWSINQRPWNSGNSVECGQTRTIMNVSTKFGIDPLGGFISETNNRAIDGQKDEWMSKWMDTLIPIVPSNSIARE